MGVGGDLSKSICIEYVQCVCVCHFCQFFHLHRASAKWCGSIHVFFYPLSGRLSNSTKIKTGLNLVDLRSLPSPYMLSILSLSMKNVSDLNMQDKFPRPLSL